MIKKFFILLILLQVVFIISLFITNFYKINFQISNIKIAANNEKIMLLFSGDLMLDRGVKKKVKNNLNNDYFNLFKNISNYLNNFDYVIVNLEGPISNKGLNVGSIYSFRMEPIVLDVLNRVNIKIFNLANNHIWDYGKEAFVDAINNLEKNNFLYFGAGKNQNYAYDGLILEKNNTRIGLIGFTEFLKNFQAKNNKEGIAFLDKNLFENSLKELRKNVDILIVNFHWGEEYKYEPNENQKYFAKKAIDLGADLVIGHHPHIVQKIEKYKNNYIFYSLGNFIFDQNFSKEVMKGGLVEVEIKNKKIENVYFRWSYLNNNFQIEKISEPMIAYEIDNKIYKLLIADEENEWSKGLMFVKKPVDFDGMIFLFPDKQIRHFWNKNTFVNLDVYWIDDDKIIKKDYLPKFNKEIKTISSPKEVNIVVELIK